MSVKRNKDIVREWVTRWNRNDHAAIGELYSEDEFDWRICGLSPVSRAYRKEEILSLIEQTFSNPMKEKLHLTIINLTAEHNRVALEAEGNGVYLDGTVFRNFYHILFTVKGEKIVAGRAYLDTWLAVNSSLQKTLDAKT